MDNFLEQYQIFLEEASVNLGRKTSKSRNAFIQEALNRIKQFLSQETKVPNVSTNLPGADHIVILQGKKARQTKKNVYVMTQADSERPNPCIKN